VHVGRPGVYIILQGDGFKHSAIISIAYICQVFLPFRAVDTAATLAVSRSIPHRHVKSGAVLHESLRGVLQIV